MTTCLQVTCGPYDLLFDLARVVEVGDSPAQMAVASGVCAWRDTQLPLIDLARRLGDANAGRAQHVVLEDIEGDAAQMVMIRVGGVVGIRELNPVDMAVLPEISDAFGRFVDAVWLDRDSHRCLLHVRLPLQAGLPGISVQGDGHE